MAVGPAYTAVDLNNTGFQIAQQLYSAILHVDQFAQWLAATPDATLLAAPYNMIQADINILKSAFATDGAKLVAIFRGTQTQATTYDFRTFIKQFVGFGIV